MGVSTLGEAGVAGDRGSRRAPVQERSQETVARVRAAAARLLARGVAAQALTTAQIAAEAGLSVGGLYRFFADKQAIVDAVALAHLDALAAGLGERLMADLPDTPAAFLGAVLAGVAAYLEAHPDFLTLAYGTPEGGGRAISAALFAQQAASGDLAAMVREALQMLYGVEPDEAFDFRLRLAAQIGDRLLGHAFAQQGAERDRVLAEAGRILAFTLFGPA
jgi:AcrR family transcriptional regulator